MSVIYKPRKDGANELVSSHYCDLGDRKISRLHHIRVVLGVPTVSILSSDRACNCCSSFCVGGNSESLAV